jgi:dihydrofolate synthase/folylpolyglutamate synthase
VTPAEFPYYNVVDQIYHAEWSTAKLSRLEILRESIQSLWPAGHPTRLIHVAGTGGKGSTCRYLEVGFGMVGKAGSFMSPHLFDYRERFSIGAEFVSHADIQQAWTEVVLPHCVRMSATAPHRTHSFHEVSILIALVLFEKHDVEWAAVETGVGGRYDQTRALDVVATALTNVGSDHAHMLGREQWQRALDKAGIARPGVPFFTSDDDPLNLEIISSVCADQGAPLRVINDQDVRNLEERLEKVLPSVNGESSLLHARHQHWNAALAVEVIQHFHPELETDRLLETMSKAQLPGRFWQVEEGVYADIAHNVEKMHALVAELAERFPSVGKILILGISGKRVPADVLGALASEAKAIIVTGASYKGQDPAKVRDEIESITGDTPVLVIFDPSQALKVAKSMRDEDDIVLLTGSTYMIDQVLNPDPYLRYLSATFGWRMEHDTTATGTVELAMPKPALPYR